MMQSGTVISTVKAMGMKAVPLGRRQNRRGWAGKAARQAIHGHGRVLHSLSAVRERAHFLTTNCAEFSNREEERHIEWL